MVIQAMKNGFDEDSKGRTIDRDSMEAAIAYTGYFNKHKELLLAPVTPTEQPDDANTGIVEVDASLFPE